MFKVESLNISDKKGTKKTPVKTAIIKPTGIEHDAHSGQWHRQISLLGKESIDKFSTKTGKKIGFGDFAENITTTGFNLLLLNPLDRLKINDTILEITQLGKKCHQERCEIYKETGTCVMPKEGIFARVIKEGTITTGDKIEIETKTFKILIITLSDRVAQNIYEDKSGPELYKKIKSWFETIGWKYEIKHKTIEDNSKQLKTLIKEHSCKNDLIFTTGGTGIGKRDITIDTIMPLLDKEIRGITDYIRIKYSQNNPNALLSRSIAGTIDNSLIFTIPGSLKAIEEYCNEIFSILKHTILMFNDINEH